MTRFDLAKAIQAAAKAHDDLDNKARTEDLVDAAHKACKDRKIAELAATMVMTGFADFRDWAADVIADETA